jgi:hypothetical protein
VRLVSALTEFDPRRSPVFDERHLLRRARALCAAIRGAIRYIASQTVGQNQALDLTSSGRKAEVRSDHNV